MSRAGCIMVQGTMSGAGKSLLCAALCRIFAQDGYKTAPFKSQNMALNSFVTRDGLEMGRAQVVQAQAAGVEPDVRMNPILLKPSSDVGSQVIVNGEVRGDMPAKEYFRRKKSLIPDILRAYDSLADEFDIIVIEGAGSPAEINLKADDIVNMGLAKLVDAPVLLAGDIDRGGVFAQLYGTVALLEQHPLLGGRYVQSVRELGAPDLVILPGTKNTVNDLLWLRQSGLEAAVLKLAAGGTPVLGVCGGYQLLGETLDDSQGTESGHPQTLRGLGLLPTRTVFTAEKRRAQVTAAAAAPFTGAALTGYEIHTGRTAVNGAPFCRYADGTPEGCVQNAVFGTYLHGLFDSGELTEQLAAYLCRRKCAQCAGHGRRLRGHGSAQPQRMEKMTPQHHLPADIERTSMGIITAELAARGLAIPPENAAVVRRVIHTTADFDYAENLRFTPGAAAAGVAAMRAGATVITDTNMALAGITKPGLAKLGGQALCFMADPAVAAAAKAAGSTRAAAAMHRAAREYPGAVLAVGNAPTALLTIADEIERGLRPALVIAVPVGFVNVVESKERLFAVCTQYGVPAIAAMGRKGGSNVAAAICNALVYSAAEMLDPAARGWQ